MKQTIILIISALMFLSCNKQARTTDEKAIIMLKDFYTSYINETSGVPIDLKKVDSILKKYCTESLLKQWKELSDKMDYDLLIDGQYCEKEWLKTMTISKDKIRPKTYVVNFNHSYPVQEKRMEKIIVLQVIENDGIVLIDKIILDSNDRNSK